MKMMKSLSKEWGNKEPYYELHPIETKIIFESQIKESTYIEKDILKELNKRQIKAVDYIKNKGDITNKEYCEINIIGRVYAFKELSELVKRNIVKAIGKGRSLRYVLVSD